MQFLEWIFMAVYGLIVVGTMVAVLLDHRQPAKTMAWMLVLIFLPLLGIILYFFFGQNYRKKRMIEQRSLDRLTEQSMIEFLEQPNNSYPKQYESLIKQLANQNLSLPFKNNETEIYTSGEDFFLSLLHEIGQAKHHIHLLTYIFEDDSLGNLVADALIDKAKEGVEVRVIYDDVGCWKVKNKFFERMREGGIDVHSFLSVKFAAFTSKINYRNHRKICVIDGSVGFIGGMNIALRYIKGVESGIWRDTHMLIRGKAVYALQQTFLVDWYFVDRTLITGMEYYRVEVQCRSRSKMGENCIIQVVTSNPDSPSPDIMQAYIRILLEAKQYVYIESPYFLPTDTVLLAMKMAAASGVDVRLIVPLHGDSKITEWASRSYIAEIKDSGIQIFFYQKGFNHSKLLIADDSLCSCGSANVDFRSFENNFEANAFVYDEQTAKQMREIFINDLKSCKNIDEMGDFSHRSFIKRLFEAMLRMLAPLL